MRAERCFFVVVEIGCGAIGESVSLYFAFMELLGMLLMIVFLMNEHAERYNVVVVEM